MIQFTSALKPPGLSWLLKPKVYLWIRIAARLGHLTIGLVYIALGAVALAATFNVGVHAVGFQGALSRILGSPAGAVVLTVIGFGLLADSGWQILRAAFNTDRVDSGLRGFLNRGGWVISGFVHLGLAIGVIKLAIGIRQASSERQVKSWTESIMSLEFGNWLIVGAAIVVIIAGLIFIGVAVTGDIDRWLDLSSVTRPVRILVIILGRFGMAARGAVLIVGGTLFVIAGVHVNPQEARGLGGTLRTIESQPYGRHLLASIALGFIAYGIFELARARYRHIQIPTSES